METHSQTRHRRIIATSVVAPRLALFVLAALVLVAGSVACGDPLTMAQETQTAVATPVAIASAAPATEAIATATPAVEPATPEPVPTVEDEPTNVPDRMGHLPTPSSDSEAMYQGGYTYVDGRPASGKLVAFIGGQECGKGQSGFIVTRDEAMLNIRVASAAERAGCGVPGATVSFTMNGQAINETVDWAPGFQDPVDLSAGPAPAIYRGTFSLAAGFKSDLPGAKPSLMVVPYIDNLACGEAAETGMNLVDHARFVYRVLVRPDEVQTGCGRDGASVVLRLQVEGGPTVEFATVPWQTLPVVQVPNVDLRNVVPPPATEAAQ
jgi:hypothetical protein